MSGIVRIVEPGHIYAVKNRDDNSEQIIKFIRSDLPGQAGSHDGILCQDLLRILMDRVHFLNKQQPCQENQDIYVRLREVLILFETRAMKRKLEKHPYLDRIAPGDDGHMFTVNDVEKEG